MKVAARSIGEVLPPAVAESLRKRFVAAAFGACWQRLPAQYSTHMAFDSPELPDAGECYTARFSRSKALEADAEVRGACNGVIRPLLEAVHGEPLGAITLRAYRMSAGDHFRAHTDAYFGPVSFVYYLSKGWRWDWGGLLVAIDAGAALTFLPRFNEIVIMDAGRGLPHLVTEVAAHAREPRYMLAGFAADA